MQYRNNKLFIKIILKRLLVSEGIYLSPAGLTLRYNYGDIVVAARL